MSRIKLYFRGFAWGMLGGAISLIWVYRKAQQFPGDPALNRYYAWIRALDKPN